MVKKWIAMILLFIGFLFTPFPGEAAAEPVKKVVLVVMDYITLQDLADAPMPTLHRMIREGGLSLMNTNTAGGRVRSHSLVTIGAGRVALGSNDAGLAFSTGETYQNQPAGEIFHRRTGREVQPENLVHLGIAEILKNNEENISAGEPGLLGEILHQAGLKTALIGEAEVRPDGGEGYGRQSAAIAMDRSGIVDFGFTGPDLLLEKTGINGEENSLLTQSANYDQMGETLSTALEKADLVVVDTGDTVRMMQEKDKALEPVFLENKQQILGEIDGFLADLIRRVSDYQTLVLVVAPTPSREGIAEKNLVTPLIYWKAEGNAGYLTSGTTRREGIVANTDIAPTVLDFFALPVPETMSGRPVHIVPGENTMESLLQVNEQLVFVYKARSPLVKGYVLGQIIVVIAAVLSLFVTKKKSKIMQPVLLALASVPLTFLLMGAYPGPSLVWYLVLALSCTAWVTAICLLTARYHRLAPFLTVSLLTTGVILIDLLLGAPLMKSSVLGYDPMGGARYYGLGNEYEGVWIGSTIIGTASLMQVGRNKNAFLWLVSAVYLVIIVMMAAPGICANAGGSIASLAGFGFTLYLMMPVRITYKQFALAGAGMVCFLLTFVMWDAAQTVGAQSHFGRTINLVRTNGFSEAYNIIVRKVAMNIKLIRWTIWSQVFLVTLAASAFLFYRPVGVMKKVSEKYPYLTKGLWGVVVGSIFALIFNDSGIVAAATMSIFAAAPLIFLVIEEQEDAY